MDKVLAIAQVTFRESVRGKILYTLLFFALIVVLVSSFFGSVTIGDQLTVIKDFGLFSISLFGVAFIVISGTAFLNNELSRKTIYNVLSKPLSRAQFLWGKYLGMVTTVVVMTLLMGVSLSMYAGWYAGRFEPNLFLAYLYILLELLIVCAYAMFFSAIMVTPLLSGLLTFAVFLAGRSTEFIRVFIDQQHLPDLLEVTLEGVYWVLPHLNRLYVSDRIVFGEQPDLVHLVGCAGYSVCYSCALLILASIFFSKREFN